MDRELAALRKVQWADCAEVDCIGVCLPPGEKCWAHAALEDREDGMKRLREDGLLDARGVPFTEELLQFLLSMAPQNDHKEAVLPSLPA